MDTTYSDLLNKDSNVTEIILVRHGQTEWNLVHRLQGQGNSELTKIGKSGAVKVGKKLYWLHKNDRPIDVVYSSPLKRAKQTCEIIMKQFVDSKDNKLEINFDDRIMERHFGEYQGKTMSEIKSNEPEIYSSLHSNIRFKPNGNKAESLLDVNNRCIQFLAQIAAKHNGKRILIISHGGCLQAILTDILIHSCIADRRFHCKNCAINIIQRNPQNGKWYLSVLGDDEYGNYQQNQDLNHDFANNNMNHNRNFTSLFIGIAIGCLFGFSAFKLRHSR